MQISRRKYSRSRRGAVRLQAQYRGRAVRKVNAATKIQSNRRMHVRKSAYRKLKSATVALQCCLRRRIAKTTLAQLKHEQKDMGKLKENNEKLKMEMASLKAMLQAQAASDAGKILSDKAIAEKQKEIDRLESRIKQLEMELAKEKENVKKLENDLNVQRGSNQRLSQDLQYQKENVSRGPPSSPGGATVSKTHTRAFSSAVVEDTESKTHNRAFSANAAIPTEPLVDAVVIGHTITPEALAKHRAEVARLEEQLEEERRIGRAARIEVKHLRAVVADKGTDFTALTEISDNLSEISGNEHYQPSDMEPGTRYVEPLSVKPLSMRVLNRVCVIVPFQLCGTIWFARRRRKHYFLDDDRQQTFPPSM
jgi:myosin heavy subunit